MNVAVGGNVDGLAVQYLLYHTTERLYRGNVANAHVSVTTLGHSAPRGSPCSPCQRKISHLSNPETRH